MRQACLDMVYEMAKTDERIFFIGSDRGVGTLDNFKQEIPDPAGKHIKSDWTPEGCGATGGRSPPAKMIEVH